MIASPDIIVRSAADRLVLIAEVKSKKDGTEDWAIQLRSGLIDNQVFPPSEYFLLVMPEQMYLWRGDTAEASPPDFSLSTRAALEPYLPSSPVDSNRPTSGAALEMALYAWLSQASRASSTEEFGVDEKCFLFDSGLLDAIKDGDVRFGADL